MTEINKEENNNKEIKQTIIEESNKIKIPYYTYEEETKLNQIKSKNNPKEIPIFDLNKIFQINFSYNFDLLKGLLETLIKNQQETQKDLLNSKKESEMKINELERKIIDMKILISDPNQIQILETEKEKLKEKSEKMRVKVIKEINLESKKDEQPKQIEENKSEAVDKINLNNIEKMVNEHEKYINQINMKLKELNMFEIFSTDGENKEEKNEGNNLIEKLESINSKIKLNSEKIIKLDESNFKLMNEIQNIKNAQDMIKRNNSLNKQSIEEIQSKQNDLERKIQNLQNKEATLSIQNSDNQSQENKIISNTKEKNIIQKKRFTAINEDIPSLFKDRLIDTNRDLDKKIKEINKKINEIDKLCKNFSSLDNYYELKSEINNIKKDANKYATNFDLKIIYNKSEENEKEIKLIKTQCEDLENNLDTRDEFKILKKKVEFFNNRIENLENNERKMKLKIDNEISTKNNIAENFKNYLEIKTFELFKSQITKEFTNINSNFIHTRKILDEITDSMKEKVSYPDLKILEKTFDTKLENLHLNSLKKYADKPETLKSFKYIEQQIKSVYEIIQNHAGDNDSWLIAKKPLNSNLCASCESYLGELKDNNPYIPWNKYPLRDTNDKIYRLGNGYSKMLQMLNIEENEKKNLTSIGVNMNINFKDEPNNLKKFTKNENSDMNAEVNYTVNNFNKTMGNFMKSPQKNLPIIKKKIMTKNKSEVNNDELNKNFRINTDDKDFEIDDEQVQIPTSPKITKIIKKK